MIQQTTIRPGTPGGYRIGIIGGGQLAKMTALAASEIGCEIVILEKTKSAPAGSLAAEVLYGDWNNPEKLLRLAGQVDVISLENEFVDADSLRAIEEAGYPLYPGAKTIGLVQDKLIQKQTLTAADIPLVPFAAVGSKQDILAQAEKLGWPLVLKARRNAYDGKGNTTLESVADIDATGERLASDNQDWYVEGFCRFASELAVMITRGKNGDMVSYPVVESVQKDHICHVVCAPAQIDGALAKQATDLAKKAVVAIDAVGTVGVEMFLMQDKRILLNEMAPRVHNSGHYTIEACECSQFENHVRAILGLPLGSTDMIAPAAAMVNMLGEAEGDGYPHGIERALQEKGAHIHVYGKTKTTRGRKMGHITALGRDIEQAGKTAADAAGCIRFGVRK